MNVSDKITRLLSSSLLATHCSTPYVETSEEGVAKFGTGELRGGALGKPGISRLRGMRTLIGVAFNSCLLILLHAAIAIVGCYKTHQDVYTHRQNNLVSYMIINYYITIIITMI